MLNYDGDSEKDDYKDVEDGEEEGRQTNEGQNMQYDKVLVFEEESVARDDDIINECMDLFEGMMVMGKFQDKNKECEQWNSILPPRVNARILKNSKESRVLTIINVRNMEYEILGPNEGYAIKLGEYSCQCGSWQASEILCRHAMAAISHHCGKAAVKDKNNGTFTTSSSSPQPIQQSTFEGSSS
ncbi:hypothetical protein LWI28_028190 [Acer negundo]|uniref:SWIM-type domain-containing protein n=1 Tax=Acer negundo TaxID=4023 RepID=A0AAD5NSJ2_ACENE|nr:hypothetical protein LWI28_028190 [Acer negundo]